MPTTEIAPTCIYCDGELHFYGVMAEWFPGCDCAPHKMRYPAWRKQFGRRKFSKKNWKRRHQRRNQHLKYLEYRDGPGCRECGTLKTLTIDHVIPRSKGGVSNTNNYQILCNDCNVKKGDSV